MRDVERISNMPTRWQTRPTEQVMQLADAEAYRLKRALAPLNGQWPRDPREARRTAYALERFSRRMRQLTSELPNPAFQTSCQSSRAA